MEEHQVSCRLASLDCYDSRCGTRYAIAYKVIFDFNLYHTVLIVENFGGSGDKKERQIHDDGSCFEPSGES